ncbi:hypothetical protein GCM10023093_03460 [Nemorincola caseinilytica]|uniref:DUF4160 domain-containing protein n=1 Tax=Nemorincola caseinilytica TaxID=2054315 RepID=A0ABP8N6T0_9BACT
MGKLLILSRYIFLIYGADINELRRHIHCTYAHKGYKRSCKFWLEPEIELDDNKTGGFSERELNEIKQLIVEHRDVLMGQLEHFYNNEPVKAIRL